MRRLVENIINIQMNEISDYNFPENDFFGLEIIEQGTKYEFLSRFSKKSDKLLCLGTSGGLNQEKFKPPVFSRAHWQDEFNESVIYYNDPTFYINKEIESGWYIGTPKQWYIKIISKIVEKIIQNRKIKTNNVLFYGSSAGGTASIHLATFIKGSTALVSNFQSKIHKFELQDHPKTAMKYCFEGLNEDEILEKWEYRFNIIEFFKKEKYVPPIIYFVNVHSNNDLYQQAIPFIEGVSQLKNMDNDIEIVLYSDKKGHSSRVEIDDVLPLIKGILNEKIYKYYNNYTIPSKKIQKQNNKLRKKIKEYESRKVVRLADKIKNLLKIY